MKIDELTGGPHLLRTSQSKKSEKGVSFAHILDDVAGKVSSSHTPPVAGSGGIDPVASMSAQSIPSSNQEQVLARASDLLDLMDKYAQALGDPKRTLKSIEPLVRRMEGELENLEISSLGEGKDLTRLSSEIVMAAKVEAMKFDRGDYI